MERIAWISQEAHVGCGAFHLRNGLCVMMGEMLWDEDHELR